MPKVSVIIPVYGVEKYIERCARSLFEQTLDDIEYIFIDDCSPDKSVDILMNVLEEYPMRKEHVIIHRMEHNSGQAAVRKWGMQNATGEYVIHCDSDDWLELDMYRAMYETAKKEDADLVVCDFYRSDGINNTFEKGVLRPDKESLITDILSRMIPGCVWNKLVKSELYKTGSFVYPCDNMGEDVAIVIQTVLLASSIIHIERPLYYYYCNPESICNSQTETRIYDNYIQSKNNADLTISCLKYRNKRIDEALIKYLFDTKYKLRPLFSTNRKYISIWAESYREINYKVIINPYLTLNNKLFYYATLIKSNLL